MASDSSNTRQPDHGPSEYRQLDWQETSSSPKTKLPGRDPSEYPQLNWTENEFAMTYRLLDIFHENESIRRAIWPGPDDEPSGKIKTDVHNEIALKLLKPLNNKYSECISRKEGLRFYGKSVKNRVFKLKESYNKAVERLGTAGAALPSEDSVYTVGDNFIREAWDTVRKTAPFFFRLRDVLGQHPNFLATKTNSLPRPRRVTSNGRRPRRTAEEIDDEGDQSGNGGNEFMDEDEYTQSERLPINLNAEASSTVSAPSDATPTATVSISAHSRGKSRKRGASQKSDTTMIDMSNPLREMTEASEKRRRISEREAEVTRRHQGSQETRRLKLAAHMEMRRVEVISAKEEKLELRRMELANAKEQRKHELEMKRLELLGQGVDVDRILGRNIPAARVETAETRNNGDEVTRSDWASQAVPGSQLMRFIEETGLN